MLSDPDAIYRCQLARKRLNSLAVEISPMMKLTIREHVQWELSGNILSIMIKKDSYLSNKKIELSPLAKDIWVAITKGFSIENMLTEIKHKWVSLGKVDLQEKLNEFIDYFWKEGIIELS